MVVVLAMLGAACAAESGEEETGGEATSAEDGETTGDLGDEADAGDGEGGGTDDDPAADPETEDPDESDAGAGDGLAWPGSPLDFAPPNGTALAVVGVQYDDSLNFRESPGVSYPVVTSLAPLAAGSIASVGEAWDVNNGVWWRVTVNGADAWANQRFLGALADTVDIYDEVAAELFVLKSESFDSMVERVIEARNYEEAIEQRVVYATEPVAFDTGVMVGVVDVLDVGDDAIKGYRLKITMEFPVPEDVGGEDGKLDLAVVESGAPGDDYFVVLTGVEMTPICGRGLSGGLCS